MPQNVNRQVKSDRKTGIVLSFIALFLLGVMPIISNSRPLEFNALTYAFYLSLWQLGFSLPLLLFELNSNQKGIFANAVQTETRKQTLIIILITGIIFSISTYLYVLSLEKAGTVSASIALVSYPLFAILWETLIYKKKKNRSELFFTLLLVTSLYYSGSEGTWRMTDISLWFVVALAVPFLWSVAHVTIKSVFDNTPITPAQVTFFRVFISSCVLFIITVSVNGFHDLFRGLNHHEFQKYAILLGFVYYLELINWFYAIKRIDVSLASSITTPWPVLTMILAVFLLHESIQNYQIVAMVVVLICLYGILYSGRIKTA